MSVLGHFELIFACFHSFFIVFWSFFCVLRLAIHKINVVRAKGGCGSVLLGMWAAAS